MTREFRVDGVLLANRVRLDGVQGLPSAAWYGEAMTAGLTVDDPDGDLDLVGWHTFTADETACSKPRIFSGWLTGRRISRGPYRTGAGRVWDCDIIDQNALFSFEVFRASSAKRPAETDIARVAWARASAPMAGTPVADNGLFNTTDNPISFGAADYVTQVPGELFASVAGSSGKNFFAYWDDVAEELSIFYDLVGSNPAAGISVSNVIADVDNVDVFYPYRDAELTRSPERVATGILFGYQGGAYVYARNETLIGPTEFSPVAWLRDEVYQTDRVGVQSTAESLAAGMLADRAREWDTIRVTVRVPASKVNLVQAGDLLTCRFTHLPGYDPETPLPIIRRTVVPSPGRRDSYDVALELSIATSNRGPGTGTGGTPGEGTYNPPSCDVDNVVVVQSAHASVTSPSTGHFRGASWASPPTAGNLLICAYMAFSQQLKTPGVLDGWNRITTTPDSFTGSGGAGGQIVLYWKIAGSSEDTTPTTHDGNYAASNLVKSNGYLIEVSGVATLDTVLADKLETNDTTPGFTLTPTAGMTGIVLTFQETHQTIVGTPNAGVDAVLYVEGNLSDGLNPGRWVAYAKVDNSAGPVDVNRTLSSGRSWLQVSVAFACSASDAPPPAAGMHVKNEFVADGDGTTTSFTTRFPYIAGTLEVFVDGVPIINGITELDPDAGTFSLDFAPLGASGDTRAERVTVNYQAGPGS